MCDEHGIEHRFTKPAHPWTNGQVERMNRTSKEATVQRYHYQTTTEPNEHLQAFFAGLQPRQATKDVARPDTTRICLCTMAKTPHYLYS